MYCKVANCRYPSTHTTKSHKCGICHQYGHGQMEHSNIEKTNNLKKYFDDILPQNKQCAIPNCKHSKSHITTSHQCYSCFQYGHSSNDCIIQPLEIGCNRYDIDITKISQFFENKGNVYIQCYAGMGCVLYIIKKTYIKTLFMHSDNWGQYGMDDRPILEKNIVNLTDLTHDWLTYIKPDITSNTNKKCPLCRTSIEDIHFIKGLDKKCIVCEDNNIEVYFPNCEHSIICKTCFKKI